MNKEILHESLNQAIVLSSLDQSDASMQDFVQEEAFFIVRYPRNWRASNWKAAEREISFTTNCGSVEGCPSLTASVYNLVEGKSTQQYAEELGNSFDLQPDYREIVVSIGDFNGKQVGMVEYLFDQTVKGELKTTRHIEYLFEGQNSRYHLDFSAPEGQFNSQKDLFAAMAGMFAYLEAP
jgi:hypothetical protein